MIKMGIGGILLVFGLMLTFTLAGAIVGIPMIIAGFGMGIAGFASLTKTTIKGGMAAGKMLREANKDRD